MNPSTENSNPGSPREVAYVALENEAHVYLARPPSINASDLLERYREILSDDECSREDRLVTAELRHHYRVSHALVRTSLSRYADVAPCMWEFRQGEHGRPEIAGSATDLGLRFNLSHTQGLVACVVCRDVDCGVDVERTGRVDDIAGVSRRVFSASEIADIERREGDEKDGRFTDYWALKEAYIKARGIGFGLPLREICFEIATNGEIHVEFADGFGDAPRDWQFFLRDPQSGDGRFRLGLALRRESFANRSVLVTEVVP